MMINKRIIFKYYPWKFRQKSSISFSDQNLPISRSHVWFWIRSYDLWMELFCSDFEMIYFERKSLFFCLIKRTKIKASGLLLKRKSRMFSEDSRSEGLYFFSPEMLILSVICCAATSKSLVSQIQNYSLIVESKI